jgi:hypothetical protein
MEQHVLGIAGGSDMILGLGIETGIFNPTPVLGMKSNPAIILVTPHSSNNTLRVLAVQISS